MPTSASSTGPVVVWLRDDLRVSDNPALAAAARSDLETIVLYVFDDSGTTSRTLGAASMWWLHHSLTELAASLQKRGADLLIRRGDANDEVPAVLREVGASQLLFNRRYPGPERAQDDAVEASAGELGVETSTFAAQLLFEPGSVRNGSREMFAVFTPFWRAARMQGEPREPIAAPSQIPGWRGEVAQVDLASLNLLPTHPDWSGGMAETWEPGEKGAHRRMDTFIRERLAGYAEGRDRPGVEASSRLSPHLKFGELSPYTLWHRIQRSGTSVAARDKFLAELGWREFDWHLLAQNPELATVNVHRQFDAFPWETPDPKLLAAWQQGRTGIPLVDAGMRQLWQTGWMHNRVRMVVASFLIKNLRYDWRIGEQWFWDTLVDADPANNAAQWQWVAGSGADAAPYFRIFNPVTQAQKFDDEGDYVRQWVPELADRSGKALFEPWTDPSGDYPAPIADLKESRKAALAAYDDMRR